MRSRPKQELLDHLIDFHTPGPYNFSKRNLVVLRRMHDELHTKFPMKRRVHTHPTPAKPIQPAVTSLGFTDKVRPVTTTTPPDTLMVWNRTMVHLAHDLDLTDPEGRATFRMRFEGQTQTVKVSTLIDLATDWGSFPLARNSSRASAVRVAADAWMAKRIRAQS